MNVLLANFVKSIKFISYKEHMKDALVLAGDEGRDKLR